MKYKENNKKKPLQHKDKNYEVKELIKELELTGQIEILSREDSWFNLTMEELDKNNKQ
jgi:hypothetical protein